MKCPVQALARLLPSMILPLTFIIRQQFLILPVVYIVSIVSANDDPTRSDKDSTISAIGVVLLWDERRGVNPKNKLEFIHQRVIVLPLQSAMSRAHQMLYDIDDDIKDHVKAAK